MKQYIPCITIKEATETEAPEFLELVSTAVLEDKFNNFIEELILIMDDIL